jgi:hypothetical protein
VTASVAVIARCAGVVALLVTTGCASKTVQPSASVGPPASTTSPGTAPAVWVAVLDTAADPARLTAGRKDALDVLGGVLEGSVVISPGACLEGLPAEMGEGYVLAIQRDSRTDVRSLASLLPREPSFVGAVSLLCTD